MHNPESTPSNPTPPNQTASSGLGIEKEIAQLATVFREYIRDENPNCYKTIPLIERVLKDCPELLPILLPVGINTYSEDRESERVVEGLQLLVSTKIAKDKHFLHSLGLLKTGKKGDLRDAKFIGDQQELLLAMLRYQTGRERPDFKELVDVELAKSNRRFIGRLKRLSRQDPVTLEHRLGSRLRLFLIRNWLGHANEPGWPPLCVCSDPVIAKLVMIRGGQRDVSDKLIRKNWERLGLHKSSSIECWGARMKAVFQDGRRVRVVVFDRNRNRA
jgi:hypothetical protein